jgi:hypothetical protein
MTNVPPVVVCLSAGPLADAARDWLEDSGADVTIDDRRSFLKITGAGRVSFDLDPIGSRAGRHLDMSDFLGTMTTYVGRVVLEDRTFTVCSDLPGLPEPPTQPDATGTGGATS